MISNLNTWDDHRPRDWAPAFAGEAQGGGGAAVKNRTPRQRRCAFLLPAQPIGDDLAFMPLGRQRGAQGFQQRRQRLREGVGRIDDIQARAVIDAGLIAIVQPMLHPQQFRDAELADLLPPLPMRGAVFQRIAARR